MSAKLHEAFVRAVMTNAEVIPEFFEEHLPDKLCAEVQMDSIRLVEEAFQHDFPHESTIEFVYQAEWVDHQGHLYFIVLFLRQRDWLVPYRIEKFVHSVIDYDLRTQNTQTIPFVLPIVLTSKRETESQGELMPRILH